jgi:hypothetical protein
MKITIKPAIQNLGNWITGTADFDGERQLEFHAKVFDEGGEYGINGGRISKLTIKLGKTYLANYDRGWDIEVAEEAIPLYEMILAEYN